MANKITSFTDLEAWQQAHRLVVSIYRITEKFPAKEQFGLTNQLRRAGVSVSSNIAEGFTRKSIKEKLQFYSVARGSVVEIQSQLLVSRDVGFLEEIDFQNLTEISVRVHMLINGLAHSVQKWREPKYEKRIAV